MKSDQVLKSIFGGKMKEILTYIVSNPLCTVQEIAEELDLDPYDVAVSVLGLINSGEVQTDGVSDGLPRLKVRDES